MNKKIMIIGGSPCSGKSTVAERIAKEYSAHYFKVDDFLEEFIGIAAERGCPACSKVKVMTPEEIWMRDSAEQCEEEFQIYDEIAYLAFERMEQTDAECIITEGAAFTPRVMKKYSETIMKNPASRYITLIPTQEFQVSHYKEREWVPYVLEGCSDKKKAFENWMNRDILFAKQVQEECSKQGISCIVNDGSRSEEELFYDVKKFLLL